MGFRFPSWSKERSDRRKSPSGCLDDTRRGDGTSADRQAFLTLYERYLGRVYRYCFVRLGQREAAEDATSEIFLRALAALPECRDTTCAAWLFRIAHNVVVDVQRRRRPTTPLDSSFDFPDPDSTPEEIVLARADAATLRAALAQLSDDQRSVIELQLAGWSHQEIAAAIGRTEAAVKMLRLRAFKRLQPLVLAGEETVSLEVPDA